MLQSTCVNAVMWGGRRGGKKGMDKGRGGGGGQGMGTHCFRRLLSVVLERSSMEQGAEQ